jgi:hypothetical protein
MNGVVTLILRFPFFSATSTYIRRKIFSKYF